MVPTNAINAVYAAFEVIYLKIINILGECKAHAIMTAH